MDEQGKVVGTKSSSLLLADQKKRRRSNDDDNDTAVKDDAVEKVASKANIEKGKETNSKTIIIEHDSKRGKGPERQKYSVSIQEEVK